MEKRIRIFKALCDPTRLKIVDFLLEGEKCACKIVEHIDRAQPTVSQQLSKLENLGLLEHRREGKSIYYRIIEPCVVKILKIFKEEQCSRN